MPGCDAGPEKSLSRLNSKHINIFLSVLLLVIFGLNYNGRKPNLSYFNFKTHLNGDNGDEALELRVTSSLLKHYALQEKVLELRKANNEIVHEILRKKKLLNQSRTSKFVEEPQKIDDRRIRIYKEMRQAKNELEGMDINSFSLYFGGKSFTWQEAKSKYLTMPRFGKQNGKNRFPAYPYISGDSFRAICKHRCELKGCAFEASRVLDGDCIYIATTELKSFKTTVDYLEDFFNNKLPKIRAKIIVIVHNGDLSTPDGDTWHTHEGGGIKVSRNVWEKSFTRFLDDEKILLYATNNCHYDKSQRKHSKLFCLPIGIENRYNRNGNPDEYDKILLKNRNDALKMIAIDKKLVELNFKRSKTKPFREEAFVSVNKLIPSGQISRSKKSHSEWMNHISSTVKFVVSPHGHGLDCHRTWEALYSGACVILKTSTLDDLYSDLPVLVLKDWNELNPSMLNVNFAKFGKKTAKLQYSKLFFPYWLEKLKKAGLKFHS